MRYEQRNLDGTGPKRTQVFDLPVATEYGHPAYWLAVTDIPCPAAKCGGTIRWAENGYVPGYRICDSCGRHFLASGSAEDPTLLRVGARRSRVSATNKTR